MKLAVFDNRSNYVGRVNDKTFYRILNNVSMTYGSVVECFRLWLVNDMKHCCDFVHTYIESQFNGGQDFLFTEGMLVNVGKPNLSLQYTINHTDKLDALSGHPSLNNMESINIMKSTQFTESIIKCNDTKNSIDVRIGFKITKINVTAGIVAQSRSQADNIAHYWTYRRQDNAVYKTNFLVDFEIPPYVIDAIYKKFNISRKSHRPMLKWLNRHSSHLVYYGLNTFNGQPRFFVKLKTHPLLRPSGMSNPQGIEEMSLGSEMWVMTRNFDIDVVIPAVVAIKGYTHPDNDYNSYDNVDFNNDITNALRNKTIEEYAVQIDDKHAISEFEVTLTEEDIKTLQNGTKISEKIDVSPMLETENLMILFNKWAFDKGLDMSDLYDFIVCEYGKTPYGSLSKNHTLSEATEKLNMTVEEYKDYIQKNNIPLQTTKDGKLLTITDLHIPNEEAEYEHYIKNSRDFWFIDLQPEVDKQYRVTLYCSLALYNQFIVETGTTLEEFISVDDAHHEYATGKFQEFSNPQDRY